MTTINTIHEFKELLCDLAKIRNEVKKMELRTRNKDHKIKIQKLIDLTEHIIPGTKDLPLRIEILERNIKTIEEMPKCNNLECNNPIYTFDTSKKRFCSRKCQSIYNNKNMTSESRMKAAKSRDYDEIHAKRLNTMENDIIQGKNAHQRSSEKAAKSINYDDVSKKSTETNKANGTYEKLALLNSKRMSEKQNNGKSLSSNIWNEYWKNIDTHAIKKRNLKIRNTNELSGRWVSDNDLTDWKLYSKKVRRLTEKVYKQNKDIIDPNNIRKHLVYDLDHIISVRCGFDNNIPIHIIASIENLQILDSIENRIKGSK